MDSRVENDLETLEGQRDIGKSTKLYMFVGLVAFSWSLFQLYTAFVPTNSTMVRSIHLSFAILLTFLLYPANKSMTKKGVVVWYDYVFAIVGALGALYIFLDFEGLAYRPGAYFSRDIVVAVITTLILLEASRRVIGKALAIVAIAFLTYDYFGPYMPEVIAHKGASIQKLAGHMFLTTEGIFGVPLGVSAGFVFLFVLFGSLLERAGAGEYFIKLAYALLGGYKGGPAKAAVVASGLTGIISGSSTANAVTTGTFTIPLMKKTGLPAYKAAAVEVAASTNGQLMPPIMGAAAFIIAEFLGLNFLDVIYAAFIPAFVSYFALFYIVHLEALKLGLQGERKENLPPKMATFLSGIHYLVPIFFLLYTLIVLRESVMSAAFNAVMFLLLLIVFQRSFVRYFKDRRIVLSDFAEGFTDIYHGMVSGAKNMIPIALATAVAGIVVGSITLTGIGQVLTEVIEMLSNGNILIILLLTAVTSLILGMGLPTTANYIVMASLTAPVIMHLAHDNGYLIPTIAAHLFVFYFGILADDTPPVGIAAYAASGIAKSDPIKTGIQGFTYDMRTAILPFMFFFNPTLILISGIDPLSPSNAEGWVWITNPFEVALIFVTATLGMFAFGSLTQGYFIKKTNIFEKIGFLLIVPLLFLPELCAEYLGYGNKYISYLIGVVFYVCIYFSQKMLHREK